MTAIYNIDYRAAEGAPVQIVAVTGHDTPLAAQEAATAVDAARLTVTTPSDLASLSAAVLIALWEQGAEKGAERPEGEPALIDAIWARLHPQPKAPEEPKVTDKTKGGKKAKKNSSKKKATEGSTAPVDDGMTASSPGDQAGDTEGAKPGKTKDTMKTKKKATKEAAPKNGAAKKIRSGSKTEAVKALLLRKSGCTRADILKTTGWPAVSVQQMAKVCGLRLKVDKEKGKPTQYYGS